MNARTWLAPFAAFLLFVVLAIGYLDPGPRYLFAGERTVAVGDDQDTAGTIWTYASLIEAYARKPSVLLYGAVVVSQGNPSHGMAGWIPWFERWFVVAVKDFVPLEQIAIAFTLALLILDALAMYCLGRTLRWPEPVCWALAIAWAFNPFNRVRANVHFAIAGTYHLPLIFLGLEQVARRRGARSVAIAALCFWAACTTFIYLVIVAAALTPLYLVYLWTRTAVGDRRRMVKRLIVAATPAILFMTWNAVRPVDPSFGLTHADIYPPGGEAHSGNSYSPHLKTFAARPLDYLGSDIALAEPSPEWLAPRRWVNENTLKRVMGGNSTERTNGIRWLLIALAIAALAGSRRPRRPAVWYFAVFALMCFWLSLPYDRPFAGAGPSGWLWKLVHQVRVPARAGIGVHFGILAMVGAFLSTRPRTRAWRWFILALPALVIAEYPPFTGNMQSVKIRPTFSHLVKDGHCATGLIYPPYVGDEVENVPYYHFKQRLRATGCTFINALTAPAARDDLHRRFPYPPAGTQAERDDAFARQVAHLARCVPLAWVVFDESTAVDRRQKLCSKLGWTLFDDDSCVDPTPPPPRALRSPEDCPG